MYGVQPLMERRGAKPTEVEGRRSQLAPPRDCRKLGCPTVYCPRLGVSFGIFKYAIGHTILQHSLNSLHVFETMRLTPTRGQSPKAGEGAGEGAAIVGSSGMEG